MGADVNARERHPRADGADVGGRRTGIPRSRGCCSSTAPTSHARSRDQARWSTTWAATARRAARRHDTPLEEVALGGSTPLLFAARSGDVESAKLLVATGANVNDTAADGNTALIVAAHSGHGTLAALLLEHGADANAAPLGYTALHAAVLRGTLRDRGVKNSDPGAGRAAGQGAAGPRRRCRMPASTKGTPIRRWSHDFALLERWVGATPFWLAARFLEIDMMRVLAAAGADTRLREPRRHDAADGGSRKGLQPRQRHRGVHQGSARLLLVQLRAVRRGDDDSRRGRAAGRRSRSTGDCSLATTSTRPTPPATPRCTRPPRSGWTR